MKVLVCYTHNRQCHYQTANKGSFQNPGHYQAILHFKKEVITIDIKEDCSEVFHDHLKNKKKRKDLFDFTMYQP